MHEGFECGIGLSNNQDLREGDIIETYEEREIPRSSVSEPLARGCPLPAAPPAPVAFAEGQAGALRPILEGCPAPFRSWPRPRWAARTSGSRRSWACQRWPPRLGHVAEVLDSVERFVWSFPEVEVVSAERSWLET